MNGRWFYDSILNVNQIPLSKGQSYTFHLIEPTGPNAKPLTVSLKAAVFSDGTAIGEKSAVQDLWNRRLLAVSSIQEVFKTIDEDLAGVTDASKIIAVLTQRRDARIAANSVPNVERNEIKRAYDTVIGNLQNLQSSPPQRTVMMIEAIRKRETSRAEAMSSSVVPAGIVPKLSIAQQ